MKLEEVFPSAFQPSSIERQEASKDPNELHKTILDLQQRLIERTDEASKAEDERDAALKELGILKPFAEAFHEVQKNPTGRLAAPYVRLLREYRKWVEFAHPDEVEKEDGL